MVAAPLAALHTVVATPLAALHTVVAALHTVVAALHTVVAAPLAALHTVVATLHTVVATPHTLVATLHTVHWLHYIQWCCTIGCTAYSGSCTIAGLYAGSQKGGYVKGYILDILYSFV